MSRRTEVGCVDTVGKANIEYAEAARDAAVQLADTVAPAALKFATTRDALTKTMVDSASGLKETYDAMGKLDVDYGKDVAEQSRAQADKIAGLDKTLATAISDASKLRSDTVTNAQQVDDHALADAAATQSTADFASSQKEDQANFQANVTLETALANADVAQNAALDQAALTQEQADSDALQAFEDGSNAAVKQAETQLITANQTWVITVVQAEATALVQDSGFNPAISNEVAAWETFELSALGSWVTSMTGQAAADEAQGDAQDLADKIDSDAIAGASVAADTAMNAAGLKWVADEIKLAKEEFKSFQLADLGYANSAISADKKQAYAASDAAQKANLDSAKAVQKAESAVIDDQYELAKKADQIVQINYNARLDAALAATTADESAIKSFVTGVAGDALQAADGDAAAREGEVAGIAAADAKLAVAEAKKVAAKNNQTSADNLAKMQAAPPSDFGASAKSVPIKKIPNAFWEWIITMPGLDPATNFVSGMGDALTFNATKMLRQNVTIDLVNYESGNYNGGYITGSVIGGVISFAGSGGACILGGGGRPSLALANAYAKVGSVVGTSQAVMRMLGGTFSFMDVLTVLPAAGAVLGRMRNWGCFVIDTPVAVGWNYEPIYAAGQAFQPDTIADQAVPVDPAAAEDGTINLGWMLAGMGIVVTTVYIRNKRDDEECEKRRSRRLIFANGKFVAEPEDDDEPLLESAEGAPNIPPLARGGQGGSLSLPAGAQLPNDDVDPLLAAHGNSGDNQPPEFSTMPSTTTILRSRAADTSARPAIEFVIPRETSRCISASHRKIRNPKSQIRNLLWCLPLLLAGLCFWKGLQSAEHSARPTATAAIKAPATAVPTKRTLITRPIQDIRPGQRVTAKNPELASQDVPQLQIEPEFTRLVSLHMLKPDGHELEIDTLVTLDILLALAIDDSEADPESTNPAIALPMASPLPLAGTADNVTLSELLIGLNEQLVGHVVEMNLPELGAEGPATITSIHPCPTIEPDDATGRRLVTSVFRHSAANVCDLQISGSDDSIGVTANHPFWSEDRQEFVPAGELRFGENLRRADSTLVQVTRITPRRGPPAPVFNFEVDGEHVYSVGADGLLVHNACGLNNANSRALNHGYIMFNKITGEIYKVGISATKLINGQSPRALAQIAKIARKNGVSPSEVGHIVADAVLKGRAAALNWERYTVGFFRQMGHALVNNKLPTGSWP